MSSRARSWVAHHVPEPIVRRLRAMRARRRGGSLPVGHVRVGDLARTTPLSDRWGFDRGTPVDRVYIESFLDRHRADVRGRVLEIADDGYTKRFGTGVTHVDVLSASEASPAATIVADLADAPQIPDRSYDCAIVTQTLQYIWDVRGAVATLHRILAPGGVALVSLPSVIRIDDGAWPDLWRFTTASAGRLFGEVFGEDRVEVGACGNTLAAAAFLYGMAAEELDAEVLAEHDPRIPVTIVVRAQRRA